MTDNLTAIMEKMPSDQLEGLQSLALGRLLRLGSRKTQSGDLEQYEKVRSLMMTADKILKSRESPWWPGKKD